MKIGIFTECYKPVINGVVVSIETFKNALEEKGHEVFVFAPDNDKAVAEHGVYRFPAVEIDKKKLYPVLFPSIDIQKTYLPEEIVSKLDIIHSQHMFTAGRLALFASEKYHKPIIYTYHTLISDYSHYTGILAPLVRVYLINMSKRFCNKCDQIIAPSSPMKKLLVKYGVKTPIEVIMTGIDNQDYKHVSESASKQIKEKYRIPEDKKILLYLSRIAKEKNIDFLLKSFVKIKKEYSNCHLVMAGGGPEEKWCRGRIQDLGLGSQVTMTGMLPKEEANQMFGMADIFTFPSVTETQGIVIAEAMASGTPPVAVGKMGPVDLIHDGEDGYLTKLNMNDFAGKVVKLLKDDSLRKKFSEAGLERVNEFSTETSTEKLIELYEKVLSAKASKVTSAVKETAKS